MNVAEQRRDPSSLLSASLIAMIRDLVRCRFDEKDERLVWPIRLHFLHDPILSSQAA